MLALISTANAIPHTGEPLCKVSGAHETTHSMHAWTAGPQHTTHRSQGLARDFYICLHYTIPAVMIRTEDSKMGVLHILTGTL